MKQHNMMQQTSGEVIESVCIIDEKQNYYKSVGAVLIEIEPSGSYDMCDSGVCDGLSSTESGKLGLMCEH